MSTPAPIAPSLASAHGPKPPNTLNPWLLVAIAASILLITSGIRLSLGLCVKPIANGSDIDIVQLSFALAVAQPITGALANRFGAWWILLLGTILLAVGFWGLFGRCCREKFW